jgi:hypothetical protein
MIAHMRALLIFPYLGKQLYLGNRMDKSLLCPNQMRAHGRVVNDIPVHLSPKDNPLRHEIYAPEQELKVPLSLSRIISYFNTRQLTTQEIETCQ